MDRAESFLVKLQYVLSVISGGAVPPELNKVLERFQGGVVVFDGIYGKEGRHVADVLDAQYDVSKKRLVLRLQRLEREESNDIVVPGVFQYSLEVPAALLAKLGTISETEGVIRLFGSPGPGEVGNLWLYLPKDEFVSLEQEYPQEDLLDVEVSLEENEEENEEGGH